MSNKLEEMLTELEHAVISENDRGWSGRGAEERTAAARRAIRELFEEQENEAIEREIHHEMERGT